LVDPVPLMLRRHDGSRYVVFEDQPLGDVLEAAVHG
jgi:hypothetical protein